MTEPRQDSSAFEAAYHRGAPLFGVSMSRELRDYLDEHPAVGAALDLGCGDGRDSVHLLRRGFRVSAVDRSSSAVAALEERPDVSPPMRALLDATVADVRTWEWPVAKFDLVMATTLLDHLADREIPNTIAKMLAAAKPGALIFVQVHTTDDPAITRQGPMSEFASEIQHYFAPNELLNAFTSSTRIVRYEERIEWDFDHGTPHTHGFAVLLGRVNSTERT